MSKITPLSGFPEWSPANRVVEQHFLDRIRRVFELHGFASLETRAVEPLETLLSKGETSKEVYLLRRLQADAEEPRGAGDAQLGLHFDLTVPFARYVLENAGKLQFPFRRYQIQKVWRGERPQEGRYREFYQCDIDIVDRDTLPAHYEAEIPLVIGDVFAELPLPKATIQVNNRKILEGFYRGLGLADPMETMRIVDKLDKIGPKGVLKELVAGGVSEAQASACLALAEISAEDGSFAEQVLKLGVTDPLLDEGLAELVAVVETAAAHSPGLCRAELKIARGLDYYTGTVYETQLAGYESIGSVCSGGRYDNLASSGDERYPGVGISIGLSRLLGVLFGKNALSASRGVPTCVLIALTADEDRAAAMRTAASLRARGIAVEVSPSAAKFGKQIRYAERRGIPFVWFSGPDGDSVKDIRSGDQIAAEALTWNPPAEDRYPTVSGPIV
ncbi:histidyl-tRNA synthetase [Hamadaea flava]|uniref:Histidine--tRNA ligase n=1 Tax=Hamadaea flava TaxID=1742688 RepID=A0ABV8LPM7_9ACTN|nr:histidine--tRNA ligase [Hamadaea flava]MCP2322413.1 histidyl-tRNA synthetase [Hamadaea flava]